jgi:hypothetical protein
LKRRSRFVAGFVIVAAGCYHRLKMIWDRVQDYATDETFLKSNENLPPIFKSLYTIATEKFNDLKSTKLPPPDEHELKFKKQIKLPAPNYKLMAL